MKPVAPHPEAEVGFDEAVDYYERAQNGLGRRFRASVETAIDRIRQNPKSFPMYEDAPCRECPVSKFPFVVYYIERDTNIWVLAFGNQYRQPGYWLDRLQDR